MTHDAKNDLLTSHGKKRFYLKKGYKTSLFILLFVATVIAVVHFAGLGHYLSLSFLQEQRQHLKELVEQNYLASVLMYIAIFTGALIVGLPVVMPLTLVGGFLFGIVFGVLYAGAAIVFGTMLSFLLIRYLFGSLLRKRMGARLEQFRVTFNRYGAWYILLLNLLMVIPFFVINSLAALTDISTGKFILVTLLGNIPLLFIYALAGQQLSSISTTQGFFFPTMLTMVLLVVLLLLLPVIVGWFRRFSGL